MRRPDRSKRKRTIPFMSLTESDGNSHRVREPRHAITHRTCGCGSVGDGTLPAISRYGVGRGLKAQARRTEIGQGCINAVRAQRREWKRSSARSELKRRRQVNDYLGSKGSLERLTGLRGDRKRWTEGRPGCTTVVDPDANSAEQRLLRPAALRSSGAAIGGTRKRWLRYA